MNGRFLPFITPDFIFFVSFFFSFLSIVYTQKIVNLFYFFFFFFEKIFTTELTNLYSFSFRSTINITFFTNH